MFGRKKKSLVPSLAKRNGGEAKRPLEAKRDRERRRRHAVAAQADPKTLLPSEGENRPASEAAPVVSQSATAFASTLPDRAFGLGDLFTEK